jgi:hypothetical protein
VPAPVAIALTAAKTAAARMTLLALIISTHPPSTASGDRRPVNVPAAASR